jgi:hypothetical protein
MTKKSVWETLSKINVNDHTEKKNGLTYLSWAWAWGVLKEHYPEATFEKHIQDNGMPYIMDANGFAYVQVTVTVDGISATELFPVLDYKKQGRGQALTASPSTPPCSGHSPRPSATMDWGTTSTQARTCLRWRMCRRSPQRHRRSQVGSGGSVRARSQGIRSCVR